MSGPDTALPSSSSQSHARIAPGPPGLPLLGNIIALQRDPLGFLMESLRGYGDVVQYHFFTWPAYAINHSDGVKHLLQENSRNYNKDVFDYNLLKGLLGQGLLTNEGESWLRQRRLIQPAFHRQRIVGFAALMTGEALAMLERWEAISKDGQPLDISAETMRLTLRIVCKALFSEDIGDAAETVGTAFTDLNRRLTRYFYFPFPPLSVPTPGNLRIAAAGRKLMQVVDDLIRRRRENDTDNGDLLFMLLHAQDEETGERMSDKQLSDEVMTLLLAGHETTSNALSWTWYLLAQHPEVVEKLHAELDTTLGGHPPTMDDLTRLPYNRMVIEEALRLYPPAYGISRKAIAEDEICGYRIPANAYIFLLPYAMHRHPDFWEHPDAFDPERFTPERSAGRPRYAYFPFGGGPRQCIGNTFALAEAQLILATVAQRYRLSLVPGQRVDMEPLITLRPRGGLHMYLHRRNQGG